MSKLGDYNSSKIPLQDRPPFGDIYRCIKVSDDVFDGCHPNGIDEGYIVEGSFINPPTVGERFEIRDPQSGRYLSTSLVEAIVDEWVFKTENSTYQLVKI